MPQLLVLPEKTWARHKINLDVDGRLCNVANFIRAELALCGAQCHDRASGKGKSLKPLNRSLPVRQRKRHAPPPNIFI